MSSKLQFELAANGVNIETLWRALTKDVIEINKKAVPDLITDSKILEGDEIGLGSLLHVNFGPAAPDLAVFKERIVEFDETKHLLTLLGVEGGYMDLGFSHILMTFNLDDVGAGNTLISANVMYDLKENVDGTQLLDGFLKLLYYHLNGIISYLQQQDED